MTQKLRLSLFDGGFFKERNVPAHDEAISNNKFYYE
jgi:hypothetical protein